MRKHYDAVVDTYATTWTEIDVACEACHWAGERHVAVAKAAAQGGKDYPADRGLRASPCAPLAGDARRR